MKHLLVIGASGVLGGEAAAHFMAKGYKVSAFVRDKTKVDGLQ